MKKVVCVSEEPQQMIGPRVKKGHVYTVTGIYEKRLSFEWYFLLEMPRDWVFREDLFIDLIEDQQDEACFVRDYNKISV